MKKSDFKNIGSASISHARHLIMMKGVCEGDGWDCKAFCPFGVGHSEEGDCGIYTSPYSSFGKEDHILVENCIKFLKIYGREDMIPSEEDIKKQQEFLARCKNPTKNNDGISVGELIKLLEKVEDKTKLVEIFVGGKSEEYDVVDLTFKEQSSSYCVFIDIKD